MWPQPLQAHDLAAQPGRFHRVALDSQAEAAPSPTPTIIENAGDVPRIALDEAKVHFDNGTAIFVDTRGKGDYDIEHIDGAVLSTLPVSKLGNTIPKDQLIIT